MADPIFSIITTRLALYAAVAAIKRDEEWNEENVHAALYLMGCVTLDAEHSLITVAQLAGLDESVCRPFAERMQANHMVPAELVTYYCGEDSRMPFELDLMVLLGLMNRTTRDDGTVGYEITPRGFAQAKNAPLPKEVA